MVFLKGDKRIFETPIEEDSTNSSARAISLYGVTDYSQVQNVILTVLSKSDGNASATSININELGAKPIKYFSNGAVKDIDYSWIYTGEVYRIMYTGFYFLLLDKKASTAATAKDTYVAPEGLLTLTSESTAEEISAAFNGEEGALTSAIYSNKIIQLSSEDGKLYNVVVLYSAITETSVDLDILVNQTILRTYVFKINNGAFTSVEVSELNLIHDTSEIEADIAALNTKTNNINTSLANIIVDMPEQIRAWSVGDGTSYPPSTPNETTLTAYMTTEVKNQLGKYVDNGTILRSACILSGADRKSLYTYLYVVNLSYSSMNSGDYEYTFNNISGGVDFYIYWDSSESKWYWNQKGLIQGEPCFVEGTKVLTPNGLINIEDIKAGDEVISYNFNTLQNETKTVTETYTHPESIIYTIEADGEKIQSTGDHPFYVVDKLAVEAKNLAATDKLRNVDGEEIAINSVSFEITDTVNVYEIAVEDTHTYYVGDNSVLVYNEPAVIK